MVHRYHSLPLSLVKSINQTVNFCLDLLEWLEMLPINRSLQKEILLFFVSILTYKKLFEKLLGRLKPCQPVNPPEKTGWLRAWC